MNRNLIQKLMIPPGSPYIINETTFQVQYHPKILKFENEADGFVVAWSQSQGGSSFAVVYQRFNADGSKNGNEESITTLDDPIGTVVLTSTDGNDFQIYAGRTDETFSVSKQPSTSNNDGFPQANLSDGSNLVFFHAASSELPSGINAFHKHLMVLVISMHKDLMLMEMLREVRML